MSQEKKIASALISVYYKDHLEPVVKKLHALGVSLYSTGGTLTTIQSWGIPVTAVEKVTSYPEIFGGRVKTLHPAIFGGILNRRENETDRAEKAQHAIPDLDLVVVDLYPFESTVATFDRQHAKGQPVNEQDIIEKIDIGGISLIRAAAKNYNDVLIISSRTDYNNLLNILEKHKGVTDIELRRRYAAKAFAATSHYDSAIFNWFNRNEKLPLLRKSFDHGQPLRYGENPHQSAEFYGDLDQLFTRISGKELSYNNLLDIDAAVSLIADFEEPTFAILKHNNACGVASRKSILEAYRDALAADPVSAFGGILIANRRIDLPTAEEINKLFCEVVIAPAYSEDALGILKTKTNRILLEQKSGVPAGRLFRSLLNGAVEQDRDAKCETAADLRTVTKNSPGPDAVEDLLFANKVVKHTKSNTIVLAKNRQLLASGTGQTSRVDALRQAIAKAKSFGFDLRGSVMASDAFFPFPDCVEIADGEGIRTVIQPGGSVKDKDSIAYCDQHGMSMVFTGIRHFKH